MRIRLDTLSSPRFELSLPRANGPDFTLMLENVAQLGGGLERTADAVRLMSAALRECQILEVAWLPPERGLVLGSPARVIGLEVDGDILTGGQAALPVRGHAALQSLEADELTVALAGGHVRCGLRAAHVDTHASATGDAATMTATLGEVLAREVQAALGSMLYRAAAVHVRGASLAWEPAPAAGEPAAEGAPRPGVALRVGSMRMEDVRCAGPLIEIAADEIALDSGLELEGGTVRVPALTIGKLTVAVPDLDALRASPEQPPEPPACEDPDAEPAFPAEPPPIVSNIFDLGLLDALRGKLHADCYVEVRVPIFGRRRATHRFRVPLQDGALDFRQLERGLSPLENSIIDFEVRRGMLVLERDLPIIGMRKDLLRWPLDPDGMALAREHRVRLRTLPHYELPPRDPRSRPLELRALAVSNIDIEIQVPARVCDGTGVVSPGGVVTELAVGQCRIRGSLRHPDTTPQAVHLEAEALAVGLRDLALGNGLLLNGRVAVERVTDAEVRFEGMRPRSLAITLHGLRITGAVLGPGQRA